MNQPTLFEQKTTEIENVILFALGDFQSRKKVLVDRELPLDRLRGAFKRAYEVFEIEELTDEQLANALEKLGAKVIKVPIFVAKHPFRITVQLELADRAFTFFIVESVKANSK